MPSSRLFFSLFSSLFMLGHKQECYQKYICIKNLTESKTPKCLTQYGYYHISPQDFNGASGDKVEG